MEAFTTPFRHWIADDWAPPALVRAADAEWPDDRWLYWHRYESADARKLGTRDPDRLPPACRKLCERIAEIDIDRELGIAGTFPDTSLYGGGMHALCSGGHLNVHLDGDHHTLTGWRRRLSVMLYVNPRWEPSWGGALELWPSEDGVSAVSIAPLFNRLVIFECGDSAFHGVPRPVHCPVGEQRRSLAVFFYSAADGVGRRDRARFVGP